jgi:hypothetical protein
MLDTYLFWYFISRQGREGSQGGRIEARGRFHPGRFLGFELLGIRRRERLAFYLC